MENNNIIKRFMSSRQVKQVYHYRPSISEPCVLSIFRINLKLKKYTVPALKITRARARMGRVLLVGRGMQLPCCVE